MMNFVSPGYFDAMRMSLRAGRKFSAGDTTASARVAIVNETFARKFFGTTPPIGQTIRIIGTDARPGDPIQIVGIVADAKYLHLREPMPATAFVPISQIPERELQDTYALRTAGRPGALTTAVEAAVADVSHDIPLRFTTLETVVDDAMVQERLLAMLSSFFGTMALLLAMVGLYGTISYGVTLRRPEFGIRKALGAPQGSIVRLVIREVAIVVVAGTAAGAGISLLTTTALDSLLFGLRARDVSTLAFAAILLAAVALAAAYLPARRASRVEPMTALRCE